MLYLLCFHVGLLLSRMIIVNNATSYVINLHWKNGLLATTLLVIGVVEH